MLEVERLRVGWGGRSACQPCSSQLVRGWVLAGDEGSVDGGGAGHAAFHTRPGTCMYVVLNQLLMPLCEMGSQYRNLKLLLRAKVPCFPLLPPPAVP